MIEHDDKQETIVITKQGVETALSGFGITDQDDQTTYYSELRKQARIVSPEFVQVRQSDLELLLRQAEVLRFNAAKAAEMQAVDNIIDRIKSLRGGVKDGQQWTVQTPAVTVTASERGKRLMEEGAIRKATSMRP